VKNKKGEEKAERIIFSQLLELEDDDLRRTLSILCNVFSKCVNPNLELDNIEGLHKELRKLMFT
jgi:hypothetical protein